MKNMHVLIDFSQIPVQKVGVGVYGLNFILNIEADKNSHYYIIIQDDDNSLDEFESKFLSLIKINSRKYRKLFYRFFFEQFYIPYLVFKYEIDIVHSLHYSFPILTSAYKVVTVCDMIFYKYPKLHLWYKVLYFRFFIWLTKFFADRVICISKSTEQDYLTYFKVKPGLTKVIELGKDKIFKPDIDQAEIIRVLEKYKIRGEYILFIGTIEPRKNIYNLIKAYYKLLNEGYKYRLIIVGKKGWHYDALFNLVNELEIGNEVVFTGFIEESEKPAFLVGAKVFVYPSFYEGFGIPVLEALACGTPTITSNISSMPEVAGDAALLIDPTNIEMLYSALKSLIDDNALSDKLRNKATHQAKKFTWQKTARKTVALYKSIMSKAI